MGQCMSTPPVILLPNETLKQTLERLGFSPDKIQMFCAVKLFEKYPCAQNLLCNTNIAPTIEYDTNFDYDSSCNDRSDPDHDILCPDHGPLSIENALKEFGEIRTINNGLYNLAEIIVVSRTSTCTTIIEHITNKLSITAQQFPRGEVQELLDCIHKAMDSIGDSRNWQARLNAVELKIELNQMLHNSASNEEDFKWLKYCLYMAIKQIAIGISATNAVEKAAEFMNIVGTNDPQIVPVADTIE